MDLRSVALKLYSGPLSMFGAKVQIAALEKGLAVDVEMVPFDFHRLYVPRHPEVARINPKAQVPVLVAEALELFDSTQIFEYLEDAHPEPPLWPRDIATRARARLLELRADEIYFPHVVRLMGLQGDLQGLVARAAIDAARRFHLQMDEQLAGGDYLAGGFSFADIAFYMAQLFGERQGATLLDEATPRLARWRERMSARPAVRAVVRPMSEWLLRNERPLPAFMQAIVRD